MNEKQYTIKTIKYPMLPNATQREQLIQWIKLGRELYNLSIRQYMSAHEINRALYLNSLPVEQNKSHKPEQEDEEQESEAKSLPQLPFLSPIEKRHPELQGIPCDILTYSAGYNDIKDIEKFRRESANKNGLVQYYPDAYKQSALITQLKERYKEFNELPSALIIPILKRTQRAYKDYHENIKTYKARKAKDPKTKFPKLHFSTRRDPFSLCYEHSNGYKLETFGKKARIFGFPKIKKGIKVNYYTPILGEVRQQAITKDGDRFYLCITYRHNLLAYPEPKFKEVGIDIGIARNIQLSDNKDNYRNLPEQEKELVKALEERKNTLERRVSKKKEIGKKRVKLKKTTTAYSKNYRKLRKRIAKIDKKIAAIRKYWLAMVSTEIVQDYGFIAIENLSVKNMTKSAKGTKEKPGKNVRQKAGLNKALLNVAPFMFKTFLKNKAKEYGRIVVEVDPKYTSQICSKCGHKDKESRESQALFKCTKCGHETNADHNASINILKRAIDQEQNQKSEDMIENGQPTST